MKHQSGYVSLSGVVVLATAIGLLAAWNMGADLDPRHLLTASHSQKYTEPEPEIATPEQPRPTAHVQIQGHPRKIVAVTFSRENSSRFDAYLVAQPQQTLGLDIPIGTYTVTLSTLPKRPTPALSPSVEFAYKLDLTPDGVILDIEKGGPPIPPYDITQ